MHSVSRIAMSESQPLLTTAARICRGDADVTDVLIVTVVAVNVSVDICALIASTAAGFAGTAPAAETVVV
jgi:hypothetical protein